ncbi:MAG: NTP transferase domain-containing protein [bacterium]|nr:NTP transferase domain-containing protein [bacterium]
MDKISIILAAGMGKRMRSDLPKVIHTIHSKPMVKYVIDAAELAGVKKHILVVGHKKELVEEALAGEDYLYAVQKEQKGTGHAVQCVSQVVTENDRDRLALILCGDTPCLRPETLHLFLRHYETSNLDLLVLSTPVKDPSGYGRIMRDKNNLFTSIREHKDCNEQELRINEINTGIYAGQLGLFLDLLHEVKDDNEQSEFYLTDVAEIAKQKGLKIEARCLGAENEFLGVNSPAQLELARTILTQREDSTGYF